MSHTSDIRKSTVSILLNDLRVALNSSQILEAAQRAKITIDNFELTYLAPSPTEKSMYEKLRLVVEDISGNLLVCDEYYPEDQGRVHCRSLGLFGVFSEKKMLMEINKVSFDILDIVYLGKDWPSDIASASVDEIVNYFKEN